MPPDTLDHPSESSPLLPNDDTETADDGEQLRLTKDDPDNPRAWTRSKKLTNVALISSMAILSPLASSMFTPGIRQMAQDLNTTTQSIIGTTTGFVVFLGVGPLILAPLSETFGRRSLYVACFGAFAALNVPTALAPNVGTLIALRSLSGFLGSVGVANGGGTLSDMFGPAERASVFGWYLLGPLMGPTLGPLLGGLIVQRLGWRWIYWVLTLLCCVNTGLGWLWLRETYAPVILAWRKRELEREQPGKKFWFDGEDDRPMARKLAVSFSRPVRIFVQPIILTMSAFQALIFGTTYSLYTNMQKVYSGIYGFNTEQVGLLYLGPGSGFLIAVWFLVPRIDTVYNALAKRNGRAIPEYRLPLANIGSVFIPLSLFWFGWTVDYRLHWAITIASTVFYGVGQVIIFNTVQNYYIDSFEKYAASAIAAGTVFRSIVGGVVPLFSPELFDKVGYGWGISIFAFIAVALAPAPLIFYRYGPWIRGKFHVQL